MTSPLLAASTWRALSPMSGAVLETLSPLLAAAATPPFALTPPQLALPKSLAANAPFPPPLFLDGDAHVAKLPASGLELDVDIFVDERGVPTSAEISPRLAPTTDAAPDAPRTVLAFSFDFESQMAPKHAEIAQLRDLTRALTSGAPHLAPPVAACDVPDATATDNSDVSDHSDVSDDERPLKRAKHSQAAPRYVNFGTCVAHGAHEADAELARQRTGDFWRQHQQRSQRDTALGLLASERQRTDAKQRQLAAQCAAPLPSVVLSAAGPRPVPPLSTKRSRAQTAAGANAAAARQKQPTSKAGTQLTAQMRSKCNPSIVNLRKVSARKSCHQCKSSRALYELSFCATPPDVLNHPVEPRRCRKQVCRKCLAKFYKERPAQHAHWVCPACRGICVCAACKRQRHLRSDDASPDCDGTLVLSAASLCM